MTKSRLEAFSDGVIAIVITIMVLELKVPHGRELSDLKSLVPVFGCYVLSFLYVGIYWNNHHNMLHGVTKVTGSILWANLHLLFWLSLFPFATAWMGEQNLAKTPVAVYGCVLLAAAIAYYILARALASVEGPDSVIAKGLGRDVKGKISPVIYALGVAVSFVAPVVAFVLYILVSLMWLVPDKRFLRVVGDHG